MRVEPLTGQSGVEATIKTAGVAGAYDALARAGSASNYLVDPDIADAVVCGTVDVLEVGSVSWDVASAG